MMEKTKEVESYHRMELNVRENPQWLQTIVESICDGLIATDTNGCVIFMNAVAETLTGWRQVDAIGEPLDRVFPTINAITREVIENPALQVITTGQIIRSPSNTVLINRDQIEIPIKSSSAPVIIDEVELSGVTLVFQDDTQSRLTENQIRNSNARLQLAMESANEGMWEMNCDTLNMHFDDLCFKMLGFQSTSAIKDHRRWWLAHIHQDDQAKVMKALQDIVDKPEKPLNIDYRLTCKDRRYLWVNSKAKVIANGINGEGRLVVGIQRDISSRITTQKEKKQLEAQLYQARKMEAIGNLAGGIAHDFNNILSAVIGYTELSIYEAEKESRLHNNLNKILMAGLRAKDLTSQILLFCRHAESELKLKPIELNSLIKETFNLMRAVIPSYIDIKYEIPKAPVTITADATQIHQVVVNLCTNGFHSIEGRNGVLTVLLDIIHLDKTTTIHQVDIAPGNYACLAVKDTGTGIDSKDIDKIFDPYFTTKEQNKGTGLGLSIVRGIVESHKGFITVESLPGLGTTFSIYLPLACCDVCDSEVTESKKMVHGSERILVVDDEPTIVEMQEQHLNLLGYRVTTMTDPTEAFLHFEAESHRYDLVITDMIMPKMPGDELIANLKNIRPDIRAILCTGYSEKLDREKISELGFDGFILKPMEMTTMALLIHKVLKGHTEKL